VNVARPESSDRIAFWKGGVGEEFFRGRLFGWGINSSQWEDIRNAPALFILFSRRSI
jgi:hypothetical protein